jgi:arylsulfatase A-like enzyme
MTARAISLRLCGLRVALGSVLLSLVATGCQKPPAGPSAIRLVDLFARERAKRAAPAAFRPGAPMSEWRFAAGGSGPAATLGWQAGPGVADLAVRNGRLTGRADGDFPVLHVERTVGLDTHDVLHSVEIRLRASAGTNLAVSFVRNERLDLREAAALGRRFPWRIASPLVAGGDMRTYVLSAAGSPFPTDAAAVRHILLRPTDAAGAVFEIESVHLIFQQDYLAGIPAGVSWQGLSEIYQETLVTHASDPVRLTLDVPENAWLDLSVGTPEERPVSFRVGIAQGAGTEEMALDHTVAAARRWEAVPIDLSRYGGRRVALSLAVAAQGNGAVGFWGSPVVRTRLPKNPARETASKPRGVILVVADTLRRDHLDAYGSRRPTAPTVSRLAHEGALFQDCQAQATWTKVSLPTMLTGMYPLTHGVKDFEDRLPSAAVTLAKAYREAGYATLGLSSVIFSGRFSNLHQGFEELHEASSLADRHSSKTARAYVDRLIPWLGRHREVPFFVLLHVLDPHDPYEPPPPYDALWADPARKQEHAKQAAAVRPFIADPLLQAFGLPARDEVARAGFDPGAYIRQEQDWYDGSIRAMDGEIARLLAALRRLGLDRDVLLAFTSDHGEEFFDHGHMSHGQTVYGELTDIPLVLHGPGVKPGTVVPDTVQEIDILPTLLDLSGLPVPRPAQGRTLRPWLQDGLGGEGRRSLPVFSIKAATTDIFGPAPRDTESVAVLAGGWKLIHNVKRPAGKPEFELYDHRSDPLDHNDLAAAHPQLVAQLAHQIADWRRKAESQRLPADSATTKGLSSEELERLRSLGYIQ